MAYPFPDPTPIVIDWTQYFAPPAGAGSGERLLAEKAARNHAAMLEAQERARLQAIPTQQECDALAKWALYRKSGDAKAATEFLLDGVRGQGSKQAATVDLIVRGAIFAMFEKLAAKR